MGVFNSSRLDFPTLPINHLERCHRLTNLNQPQQRQRISPSLPRIILPYPGTFRLALRHLARPGPIDFHLYQNCLFRVSEATRLSQRYFFQNNQDELSSCREFAIHGCREEPRFIGFDGCHKTVADRPSFRPTLPRSFFYIETSTSAAGLGHKPLACCVYLT